MKYPSAHLVINAFSAICLSAANSSDLDIQQIDSAASISINDRKIPPEESAANSPLSADISFTDDEGNNIIEAEVGSLIKFNIKVITDKKYKDGKVMKCEIYEKVHQKNRKQLSDECLKDESIEEWVWDKENQKFKTNFKVMRLPESQSDEFTIECSAIICKENCPRAKCSKPDPRRKRRGLLKKLPWAIFFRARTSG